MKILMTVAVAVALASSLAACGGESSKDGSGYCAKVKQASAVFESLHDDDFAQLVDNYHQLAAAAPSEIEADWKELDDTMTTVDEALRSAGVTLSDLSSIPTGGTPEGVDPSQMQDLMTGISGLGSPELAQASEAIAAHAKETCNVDLATSS